MTRTNDVQPERSRGFQYLLVSITRRIQSVLKAKCTDLFTLTLHGGRVNKSRSLVQTSILFYIYYRTNRNYGCALGPSVYLKVQ